MASFSVMEPGVSISNAHKYLKNLSCLPIFLLKESVLGKARKGKEILALKWDASNITDAVPNEARKHQLIMNGYIGLLEAVTNAEYDIFRKRCFEASKRAYKEIKWIHQAAVYCQRLEVSSI